MVHAVRGSRGSVLQAFTEQTAHGAPLTVTHPDVTGLFMTFPDACEPSLCRCGSATSAVGRDGMAMVLEMSQSVRIPSVARQMIAMSGRDDIEIVSTGLREGEVPHEELFRQAEGHRATTHEMIDEVLVPPLGIAEVRGSGICRGEGQGVAAAQSAPPAPVRSQGAA